MTWNFYSSNGGAKTSPNIFNLDDLDDVSIASPVEGDVLTFDGTSWNKANAHYAARVQRTTDQTIANNTLTAVSFDASGEAFDPQGMWDSGSPTRLTIQKAGLYMMTSNVDWDPNATGVRLIAIRLNGSTILVSNAVVGNATTFANRQTASTLYSLAASDYIELVVQQISGGDLDINTLGGYAPTLTAHWVGPAS